MSGELPSRRHFMVALFTPAVLRFASACDAWGHRAPAVHPEPRPGITASKVLKPDALRDDPDVIPVFDMVRQIPQVVDGIRCNCGCANEPGFYSLLSCFEGDGMARHCQVCLGQARLVSTLRAEGKSLKDIRQAIDDEFG